MTTAAQAWKHAELLEKDGDRTGATIVREYAALLASLEKPQEAVDDLYLKIQNHPSAEFAFDKMHDLAKLLAAKLEAVRGERDAALLQAQSLARSIAEIEVTNASMAFLDDALNSGDGVYRP